MVLKIRVKKETMRDFSYHPYKIQALEKKDKLRKFLNDQLSKDKIEHLDQIAKKIDFDDHDFGDFEEIDPKEL
ncbi:hypothetical protein TVAG_167700 [Trichomonas vaginalis G3]|uniref:Uncharacterized protein n=1 Tax=Trichomonas vaginalis (strain ATCC PRA-98 / G3) TaxID=412133 RepID=A2G2J9_TRIV3|nr:protein of unknown function, DUF4108 family [Trichomonas vaginalis G3]EAX88623.1 hypothetical protein TVAG_167700 [Trichomonas vaginalis G3]KAI5485008.1 protein of unknown function, DUF4108 family [Trichomonas vaginalis G3]|eukprot:XP_001301553.1 hypothetical protein [Trichomonas vaginalis G3]